MLTIYPARRLPIKDRVIGHRCQGFDDAGIARGEIVVVSRAKMDFFSPLYGKGAIAVELKLIHDIRSFRQLFSAQKEHGFDERSFDLPGGHEA